MHKTQIIGVLLIIMVLVLGACSPKTITLPAETITVTPPPETITVTPPPETITVTPPAETITVTPPPETITVTPPPTTPTTFELAIEQTVSNPRPFFDENFTYTITLTNLSSIPASGVKVTDQLPAGITFVSYYATGGTYDSSTGIWTVGDLAEFTQVNLFVTVGTYLSFAGMRIANCATLTAVDQTDTNSANNSACADIIPNCRC